MKHKFTDAELATIQVEKEINMKVAGVNRFYINNERAIKQGSASETQWNRRILQELVEPMSEAIEIYLAYYKGRGGKPSRTLAYLGSLPSKKAAYLTIKVVFDSLSRETEIRAAAKQLGSRIEDEVRFSKLTESAPNFIKKVEENLKRANSKQYKHQQAVYSNAEKSLIRGNKKKGIEGKPDLMWDSWPEQDVVQLGAKLIQIFHENVTFEGKPIIYKSIEGTLKNMQAILAPSDHINDWIQRYKDAMSVLSPALAPCVIPPRDWTSPVEGGYHIPEIAYTLPLVKCRKSHLKRLTKKQMPEVYSAINALQQTAWQVSDRVYDVVKQAIALSLPLGIPEREPIPVPEVPVPEEFRDLRGESLKAVLTESELEQFMNWKKQATKIYKKNKDRKNDLIKISRILGGTAQYIDYEKIYFVYTMDFRGRVYCRSDILSPQGDDLQKGLLRFAEGLPLGETGYKWFAVHGANVWGYDKENFEDRVKFIEEMSEDIRDIAADPISFRSWANADKPFQFLNWCFEWADFQDWIEDGNQSGDFVSHIPVGMDGSCSGIQHYAAILRDPVSGKAVNLVPDVKPNDIYGDVAKVAVIELEELSTTSDDAEIRAAASGWLVIKGGFNRKITKKPSMTLTYGSTQINCLEKTGEYLVDLQEKEDREAKADGRSPEPVHLFAESRDAEGVYVFEAVKLGAKVIWKAIGKVVIGPKQGMKFIQSVSAFVGKAGSHIEWTTPTGFIVEQREYVRDHKEVKTALMGRTCMRLSIDTDKVNIRKTKSSSAPNFIHSMDASHLIKAVNAFKDAGINSIAVIHDDFGTHACHTDSLRKSLTDTFVDMYTENDVLKSFRDGLEELISQEIPVSIPEPLGLDLELVRQSEYCFS